MTAEASYTLNTNNCIMIVDNIVDDFICNTIIDGGNSFLEQSSLVSKTVATFRNTETRQDTQLHIPYRYNPQNPFSLYRWTEELTLFATSIPRTTPL